MSDDDVDLELLDLLRNSLGMSTAPSDEVSSDTGVLRDAEHIYNNAIDVSIDMWATKAAAASIYKAMQQRAYSTKTWSEHELHPKRGEDLGDVEMVNFVFTMDLLNFSFWSKLPANERYQVEYRGKRWTGYNSLVAALRRAGEEGVPITDPRWWRSGGCTVESVRHVLRGATEEEVPMLEERVRVLKEAGEVLGESFGEAEGENEFQADALLSSVENVAVANGVAEAEQAPSTEMRLDQAQAMLPIPAKGEMGVIRLIQTADHSAGKLVNLLAKHFPCFRDEARFEGGKVRFLKRAQIFVADLWAAFGAEGYGQFGDMGHLTMFADYRVPQMLHSLGVLRYCPRLDTRLRSLQPVEAGDRWEVQVRGCSIWAVELIRRQVSHSHPHAAPNAALIDFFLYDWAKERESVGAEAIPHHRARSIWY